MESERRIKRKKRKKRKILIFIIVVIAVVLGYFLANNHFVRGLYYKIDNPVSDNNPIIEFEDGVHSDYYLFDNTVISASKNGVYAYNSSLEKVYERQYEEVSSVVSGFNSLKLSFCDKYIAAFDKGGRDVVIFNNRKILNNVKVNSSIIYAKPLNNGGFIVIAEDISARNQIILYNESGKEDFIWHSGVNNIVDADYSEDKRMLSVVTADLSTGVINSKIMFFKTSSANAESEITLSDVLVTNIRFLKDNMICAISDKGVYFISEKGEIKNSFSYNERMLSGYRYMKNGNIILTFTSSNNETVVDIIDIRGNLKGSYTTEDKVLYTHSLNGNIILCEGRKVSIITQRGFLMRTIPFNRELNKAFFIGKNKIVLLGNSEIRVIN